MLTIHNVGHAKKTIREAKEDGTYEGPKGLKFWLNYLREYGGGDDPTRCKVEIGYDWAGFGIAWYTKQANGEYQFFMNGGLIFHQACREWSVHT